MKMESFFASYWPAFISFIGLVVWLARLEAKVTGMEKDVNKVENEFKNMELRIITSVDEMRKTIFELTLTLTKMMERVEHLNKGILNIKAQEIKEYLDRS